MARGVHVGKVLEVVCSRRALDIGTWRCLWQAIRVGRACIAYTGCVTWCCTALAAWFMTESVYSSGRNRCFSKWNTRFVAQTECLADVIAYVVAGVLAPGDGEAIARQVTVHEVAAGA